MALKTKTLPPEKALEKALNPGGLTVKREGNTAVVSLESGTRLVVERRRELLIVKDENFAASKGEKTGLELTFHRGLFESFALEGTLLNRTPLEAGAKTTITIGVKNDFDILQEKTVMLVKSILRQVDNDYEGGWYGIFESKVPRKRETRL